MLFDRKTPVRDPQIAPLEHAMLLDLGLLGPGFEPALDRLSVLACDLLSAPAGAISIMDDLKDCQYFKSFVGLPQPMADARQTPQSQSFCNTVRHSNEKLSIRDARHDPRFCDHPAHVELGTIAYLGYPVHLPCGTPIGAICVIDVEPRDWSAGDNERLSALAHCANDAIQRVAVAEKAENAVRQAARAMGARELFLAGLNHEIRTALNGVLGPTEVLSSLPLDETTASLIQIIEESASDLSVLLESLLKQTDPSAPHGQHGFSDVFAEVFGVLRLTRPGHAHSFSLQVADAEKLVFNIDRPHFKQLAYDLLSLAVIASPNGSTDIRLSADQRAATNLRVTVSAGPEATLRDLDFEQLRSITDSAKGTLHMIHDAPTRTVFELCLPTG